jgi:predicted alpha-1,2-mannosidase
MKTTRVSLLPHGSLLYGIMLTFLCVHFGCCETLTQYVNPWMGVLKAGNVVVGPQLPWGSVNPSPDTPDGYTSGYNPNQEIRGFSQLHVTGGGGPGKYGQFLVSPQIGLEVVETGHDSAKSEEVAGVGFYQVRLTRYNILSEMTPTRHAALYRFTYPQSDDAHLLVDLGHNIPKDSDFFNGGYADEGAVSVDVNTQTITGWGHYWGGWSAEPFRVYFAARYDRPAVAIGTWKDGAIHVGANQETVSAKKQRIGSYLKFKTGAGDRVLLKIAVSFKSVEQARHFLDEEIPDWNFERVQSAADTAWEKQLDKIQVEAATPQQKTIFYTALYNTMRMPHDRTGDNPKWKSTEPYWDDHFCIWDTWRTVFPLHILINESMVRDNLKAFCDRFQFNGQVTDAFCAGNDRYYSWYGDDQDRCWIGNQGGDDVNNVIAEAYMKGVRGVDWKACYELLKYSADSERAPAYRAQDRGWVPYRSYHFGLYCSRSMEFSYNDFCVAEMARGLGRKSDAARYLRRSRQWENLWNRETESDGFRGFIAPRTMAGDFVAFDPKSDRAAISQGGELDRTFYEGSSWIYSYFVPHDFARLIELSGGSAAYCDKLQYAMANGQHFEVLIVDGKAKFSMKPGLIDFGNEPSFMTPFSFIYAGRPDLTAFWVRKNIANYTRDGFPGDEDSGAMSSWYVFAAMGLFPNAGQDIYLLNGPLFGKMTLTRENGKRIVIESVNASPENIYVQSATLNGKPLNRAWVKHDEIKDGATIRFVMGSKPTGWGANSPPPSLSTNK